MNSPRVIAWIRYAVYFDDVLPIAVFKYQEQARSFVNRMKTAFGIDYELREERWQNCPSGEKGGEIVTTVQERK